MSDELRGIYPIMVTPFNEKDEIDEESLRSEVRFLAQGEAPGIVWPVSSSEFQKLSLDERKYGVEAIVDELKKISEANRPRFVVGTAGINAKDSIDLGRHAESAGADGVIAMPPFATHVPAAEIPGYYKRVAQATSLPFAIQNQDGLLGNAMPASIIVQLASEVHNIQYVKEESGICTHMISAELKTGSNVLKGVFGGSGGRYLIQEMERGACGSMSACHFGDIQVKVWNLYHQGDKKGAYNMLMYILPLQTLWHQIGIVVSKEILKARGVIKHSFTRMGSKMDEYDLKDLNEWLKQMEPVFTIYPPS